MKLARHPAAWTFLILLASYAFFWHGRDWNTASRLMLTYAMVDRGSLSIDGLETQTGDLARRDGHYYTEKNPGFSLLAAIPYKIAKLIFSSPDHPLGVPGFAYWPADYWITLGTSGVMTAGAGAILAVLALRLGCGPRRAALVGLAYGLATPAFAYGTLAYGHQPAAFCLLASFALLWSGDGARPRLRWFAAGALAAYASVIEIQVGPVSSILAGFALSLVVSQRRPLALLLWFALGTVGPTLILLTYNTLAFGSPWKMGYFFLILDRFKEVHSDDNPLGLARPDWHRAGELLWGERRGLIRYAPILILSIPGLGVLAARRAWGMVGVVVATAGAILLVNLSYPEWTGGWTTGPRLLVPMLPFAMLPVAALLAAGGRWASFLALILTMAGGAVILLFQGVGARVPDPIASPLASAVWPLWRGDTPLPGWTFGRRFAVNLVELAWPGFVAGLPPSAAWLPFAALVLVQILLIGAMLGAIQPKQAGTDPRPPA
ncbi:hypothetical protein TA3x_004564 [Tundrisphaera sp. TA3]|uniref:hypothetical protein n=1 Tax=Tundrisphaera sp. TA3 TaxID=3435775 RepID=UPI003EBCD643